MCLCAECRTMMDLDKMDLVQNPVFKCGELHYVELAHRACRPDWAIHDEWDGEYV